MSARGQFRQIERIGGVSALPLIATELLRYVNFVARPVFPTTATWSLRSIATDRAPGSDVRVELGPFCASHNLPGVPVSAGFRCHVEAAPISLPVHSIS